MDRCHADSENYFFETKGQNGVGEVGLISQNVALSAWRGVNIILVVENLV